jgi:hypothetical protein
VPFRCFALAVYAVTAHAVPFRCFAVVVHRSRGASLSRCFRPHARKVARGGMYGHLFNIIQKCRVHMCFCPFRSLLFGSFAVAVHRCRGASLSRCFRPPPRPNRVSRARTKGCSVATAFEVAGAVLQPLAEACMDTCLT